MLLEQAHALGHRLVLHLLAGLARGIGGVVGKGLVLRRGGRLRDKVGVNVHHFDGQLRVVYQRLGDLPYLIRAVGDKPALRPERFFHA